jgi:hypothetical protein
MSNGLAHAISHGEYEVDADAVALAMISRGRALRAARRRASCSEVLVAAERIEIRRIAACEAELFPLEDTA